VHRVTERLSQLEAFPDSGRAVPEFEDRALRELVEGDYRIVYERFADRVEVIAVVHGARSLLDP
jgi:plasmid stabilization system protein ParE